ncbi:MAG: ribosomal eL24 family protein [Nanoarchaeota archaeon]
MARCDFCKSRIEQGTGKKFIYKDGHISNFCSSKCERHTFRLKHKGRNVRWTEEYQKLKKSGKLTEDVEIKAEDLQAEKPAEDKQKKGGKK